jgi:hypothetical protein
VSHTPGKWEVVALSGVCGPYAIRMPTPQGSKHPTHYGVQGIGRKEDAALIALGPEMYEYIESSASAGCATAAQLIKKLKGNT